MSPILTFLQQTRTGPNQATVIWFKTWCYAVITIVQVPLIVNDTTYCTTTDNLETLYPIFNPYIRNAIANPSKQNSGSMKNGWA